MHRVIADVLTYFATTIIRARIAPRRFGTHIVIKINPTVTATAPTIESPQIHVGRTPVVVYNINDHSDAPGMSFINKSLQRVGTSINRFDGEGVAVVVAP